MSAHDQLLVVIDPVARRSDGESVRIAKDVLCGGSSVKICLPEGPEEFARALARRGSRRPVVVGDDRALLRAVALLHRDRWLGDGALALVPVGPAVELAHSLGVPRGAVAAARAVLDGAVRRLDLLVDESDGVVVGDLAIPAGPSPGGARPVRAVLRLLARSLVRSVPAVGAGGHRLRIEADGVVLSDRDREVAAVTVRAVDGRAEVVVQPGGAGEPLTAKALTVTVSGPDFRYRADTTITGPVRTRTWTVRAGAWGLTLPPGREPEADLSAAGAGA
ncbi:serine/threonine-protein kinase [Streptomyces yaizuensis]|uniref:Diacylglycerol kinase n=1 Tax=Streptomyces yaizuensis TaxID=2989713 RepID=A0ABQ5P0C7_9ACTN|nr:diacylglycerol kinase [Streptomyces sp. YSPA8]GLF95947.1 diacylglycerol kinase [Streptomyces sp. YSPA8]